jgi:hypothetical protein
MWITVDTLVGWLLALTPAGLIAWGLFGVVMPAVWHCATPGRHVASSGRVAGLPPFSCRPSSRTRWSRQPAGTR